MKPGTLPPNTMPTTTSVCCPMAARAPGTPHARILKGLCPSERRSRYADGAVLVTGEWRFQHKSTASRCWGPLAQQRCRGHRRECSRCECGTGSACAPITELIAKLSVSRGIAWPSACSTKPSAPAKRRQSSCAQEVQEAKGASMPPTSVVGMSKNCDAPLMSFSTANPSAGRFDFGAWLRIAVLLLVRDALIVDNLPKHVRIGRLCGGVAAQQTDRYPKPRRQATAR